MHFSLAHPNINDPINFSYVKPIPRGQCKELIDAVYIPTLSSRSNLEKVINLIEYFTKKIYILHSGKINDNIEKSIINNKVQHKNINQYASFKKFVNNPLSRNPSLTVDIEYDLPLKRNYALNHSRENNYNIIALIDDDMLFYELDVIKAISTLQSSNTDIVGFHVLDFPDKSTIDHIERFVCKISSPVSIGGNFLFMNRNSVKGFFPYVYNEDWLFLYRNIIYGCNINSVGMVRQEYHEPWQNLTRIQFEQFGEVIIYGLQKIIQNKMDSFPSDATYWGNVYTNYKARLYSILDQDVHRLWNEPLNEAIKFLETFNVSDIVNFIKELNKQFNHESIKRIEFEE